VQTPVTGRSDLHGLVADRLETAGQRYTSSRRRLVSVLYAAGRPLPIPEIVEVAGLPQSSVYRNLAVLEAAGTVRRVNGTDEFVRFELDEPFTEHHHHLVCLECGLVSDFVVPNAEEAVLERVVAASAAIGGFRPSGHRLDVLGRCPACLDVEPRRPPVSSGRGGGPAGAG
jgi:Fur family transcriptional regulator, ferric uptake regulator